MTSKKKEKKMAAGWGEGGGEDDGVVRPEYEITFMQFVFIQGEALIVLILEFSWASWDF